MANKLGSKILKKTHAPPPPPHDKQSLPHNKMCTITLTILIYFLGSMLGTGFDIRVRRLSRMYDTLPPTFYPRHFTPRFWILCFVTGFAGIPKTPEVSRLLGVGRSRGSWRCVEKLQGHSLFVRIQCLICHGRSTCGGGIEVEVVVLQLVVLSMCSRNKQGVVAHH